MIFELREQNVAEQPVSNQLMVQILRRSFLAAHLLTGSTTHAEKAVMAAIDVWNPNEDGEQQLFQITLRTAGQMEAVVSPSISHEERTIDSYLPVELRQVLELSPKLRSCFVLRVLFGLPSPVCCKILHLSVPEIDERTCEAMKTLSALNS